MVFSTLVLDYSDARDFLQLCSLGDATYWALPASCNLLCVWDILSPSVRLAHLVAQESLMLLPIVRQVSMLDHRVRH